MAAQLFLLKDFINPDEKFHMARVKIRSRQDLLLHRHDFSEIFWVENGKGTHLINGRRIKIRQGHLIMIRPDDEHNFTSKNGLTITNLAFRIDTLNFLKTRYFHDSNSYFWSKEELPFHISLDENVIRMISQKAERITSHKNSYLYLDELLLFIFRLIQTNEEIKLNRNMPYIRHSKQEVNSKK
jgi:hypothetical protein